MSRKLAIMALSILIACLGCGTTQPAFEVSLLESKTGDPTTLESGPKRALRAKTRCGPILLEPKSKVIISIADDKQTCALKVEAGVVTFRGEELGAGAERMAKFTPRVPESM